MPFAICRIQKLKSISAATNSGKHTDRKQNTPNADPKKLNIELVPHNINITLGELVERKIGDAKTRKDSVRCVEYFLGASPKYFRPNCPDMAGYFEQEKLDIWIDFNLKWLQRKHGDNLIKATVHLDEATPHIAAYVVPIHDDPRSPGQKKLSYNVDFGGSKHRLSELQDEYANDMKPLGLERGVKGSKAKHQDIKDYYSEANATLQQIQQREEDRRDWEQAVVNLSDSVSQRASEIDQQAAVLTVQQQRLAQIQQATVEKKALLLQQLADLNRRTAELEEKEVTLAEQKKQLAQIEQATAKQTALLQQQQTDFERRAAELEAEEVALEVKRQKAEEHDRRERQHLAKEFSRVAILAWQQQSTAKGTPQEVVQVGSFFVKVVPSKNLVIVADAEKNVLLKQDGAKPEATPLLTHRHLEDLRQWREEQVNSVVRLQKAEQR